MLQEAVDALFDNGRRGRVLKGSNNRPLKSLSDTLKGKQGRFRQNLLGKRVDYSGRSVVVVGPELKLHQAGLPKKMAVELFKPFIYNRLEKKGLASTIKAAKELVESGVTEVWDALEEVIRDHAVLLNRAPTLHRLGIQAFQPVLVEGKAIKIHPLVCPAFNADFDGDQMAVHVPLSPKAQVEAELLMLSSQQHPVAGLGPAARGAVAGPRPRHLLPDASPGRTPRARAASSPTSTRSSWPSSRATSTTHTPDPRPLLRQVHRPDDPVQRPGHLPRRGPGRRADADRHDGRPRHLQPGACRRSSRSSTATLKKRGLHGLRQLRATSTFGDDMTVKMLDDLKDLGFAAATRAGISIGVDDMVIPAKKDDFLAAARKEVVEVESQRSSGVITAGERHNKIIDIWHRTTETISDEMFREMKKSDAGRTEFNPIYIMADSGARGSKEQVRQLAGMRGLMSKPSGEVIETPDHGQLPRGPLGPPVLHLDPRRPQGPRRHRAQDGRLRLPDAPARRRRPGRHRHPARTAAPPTASRCRPSWRAATRSSRCATASSAASARRTSSIRSPRRRSSAIGDEITEDLASRVQEAGIERVKIRSVLTCETKRGVCRLCYGRNAGHGQDGRDRRGGRRHRGAVDRRAGHAADDADVPLRRYRVARHRAVQARGQEPGHGPVPQRSRRSSARTATSSSSTATARSRSWTTRGARRSATRWSTARRSRSRKAQEVEPGQELVEWDPFTSAILTEVGGNVEFRDIVEGENLREETDRVTGLAQNIIVETVGAEKRSPQVIMQGRSGESEVPAARSARTSWSPTSRRSTRATCWPRSRARRPRPRTSRAVCRASSSSSRLAGPKDAGRHHRDRRQRVARPDRQGHAQGHRHRRRRGRPASTSSRGTRTSTCRKASACAPAIR